MEFSKETIIDLFENAFATLFENDFYLLKIGVKEECIIARVAKYIEQQLRKDGETELNVDVEYNKHIENPKRNCNGIIYIPDLVIHQRGTDERNICCCEAKKDAENITDIIKIKTQMRELKYKYGVVITEMKTTGIKYIVYHLFGDEYHQYPNINN